VSAPVPGGGAQRFASGAEVRADWWRLFRSAELDALIERALAQSPNLAAASARLREAAENFTAETGARLYPRVDAIGGANRERISTAAFGNPNPSNNLFTLYNASVNVSYNFDFSGAIWRALEGLQAQVEFQAFQLEAARLSLTANLVTAVITEASLRAQLTANESTLATQESLLGIIREQRRLGGANRNDLLAQESQVAQTRSTLPPLRKQLALARHQVALLAGLNPNSPELPSFTLGSLHLPEELPLSVPSDLIRQRPDIRAAESQWHQASAQLGVATANLYPQLTLSASMGSQALTPGALFGTGSMVSSLAGSMLQPIFRGGELQARRRAAQAVYEQAEAQYRQTVLTAFQGVADSLHALDQDAQGLLSQARFAQVADESLQVATQQYQAGAVGQLVLLNAQRQAQAAQVALAQAQAARLADTAAFFQAMGGGWWNNADNALASPAAQSSRRATLLNVFREKQ
jgi:NodT family efflux transporter outer membrane factor (OMF) lipoprotein